MILVRSRGAFFEAMIRALKERGVPVAGADRLSLTEHIAVMDLMAAGRAALCPDDDFTLACVLKSPLIGLDDDDLMALAPAPKGHAAQGARGSRTRHRTGAPPAGSTAGRSGRPGSRLSASTRNCSARTAGGGTLLGRLGPEAGDAIDEFVALTLAHERDGAPSLLAFLARLEGADLSIKRDMEAAGNAVRVMTVHAAKGLEAKIVILPDTCGVPSGRHDPKLFRLDPEAAGGTQAILWSPRADADAGPVAAARDAVRQRAIEEHNRLLYVAMTRAEERLYVAGYCGEKGRSGRLLVRHDRGRRARGRAGAGLLGPGPSPCCGWATAAGGFGRRLPHGAARCRSRRPCPTGCTAPRPDEAAAVEPPIRPSNPLGAADQFAPVEWTFGDRRRGGAPRRPGGRPADAQAAAASARCRARAAARGGPALPRPARRKPDAGAPRRPWPSRPWP